MAPRPRSLSVETTDGRTLHGLVLNQTSVDLQILSDDNRIHLLRREGERYRAVTSQDDWPTYHGQLGGNRYSTLAQIDKTNVTRLAPRWTYSLTGSSRLQVTPVVVDGVMYVTTANECHALDAGTGRRIWDYRRPRTKGLAGDAASGINRGVAVAGDRVFMVTDNAHLIALDRFTGALLWDTEMADWRQNYGATSAPLAVGGLVVSGIFGRRRRRARLPRRLRPGDGQGGVALLDRAEARRAGIGDLEGQGHRSSRARPPGSPAPTTPTSTRSTGRPAIPARTTTAASASATTSTRTRSWPSTPKTRPRSSGTSSTRRTTCGTGTRSSRRCSWIPTGRGSRGKLLLHANRNGFFYVLDRTTGALLLAKPFVKKLTWAREIGADGRPVLNPGPGADRRRQHGLSGGGRRHQLVLDVVQSRHGPLLRADPGEVHGLHAGARRVAGGPVVLRRDHEGAPDEPGQKVLRAIDVEDRRHRLGAAADRPGPILGRHARHRQRPRLLRRRQRRPHGGRRLDAARRSGTSRPTRSGRPRP